jgi:hypothetical protein
VLVRGRRFVLVTQSVVQVLSDLDHFLAAFFYADLHLAKIDEGTAAEGTPGRHLRAPDGRCGSGKPMVIDR